MDAVEEAINDNDPEKAKADDEADEEDEKPVDYQLERALDLINGLSLYTNNTKQAVPANDQTAPEKEQMTAP